MASSFSSPQRRTYTTSKAWDSLKTGSNTWVVVWDNSDFTGYYLKFSPNSGNSDLNKTDRGSSDWKNQVKSFVMYDSEPSWWNDGSAPPQYGLNLSSIEAMVCADQNYCSDAGIFSGEADKPNLSSVTYPTASKRDMKNNISSVATGHFDFTEAGDVIEHLAGAIIAIFDIQNVG